MSREWGGHPLPGGKYQPLHAEVGDYIEMPGVERATPGWLYPRTDAPERGTHAAEAAWG